MKLYIVDAFTDQVFGGNPAGVVYIPAGADFPDDETMRKTAAELRYSETAFAEERQDRGGRYLRFQDAGGRPAGAGYRERRADGYGRGQDLRSHR